MSGSNALRATVRHSLVQFGIGRDGHPFLLDLGHQRRKTGIVVQACDPLVVLRPERIVDVTNSDGDPSIRCGDRLRVSITYTAQTEISGAVFLVGVYDHLNRPIFFLDSAVAGGLPHNLPSTGTISCETGPINLTPGPCIMNAAVLVNGEMADHVGGVSAFDVEADDFYGTGRMTNRQTTLCLIHQDWQVQ